MGNIVKKFLTNLIRVLPLRNDIILESHPDFSDNTGAFYEYLLKQGTNDRMKIHWAIHGREPVTKELPQSVDTFRLDPKGFRENWKRLKVLYTSRYIVDCNSFIKKRRKGQIRVHTSHGMPFKLLLSYSNYEVMGEMDRYLVTSGKEIWREIHTKIIGLPEEKLLPLGFPRNDVLVRGCEKTKKWGNYIVWMPTYRQHRNRSAGELKSKFPYGMPEVYTAEHLETLNEELEHAHKKLLFRPHPAQNLQLFEERKMPFIEIADDAWLREHDVTLYEMVSGAEALVTDYSTIYYDFLLTGRPVGLTMGDAEEFFEKFYCPFENLRQQIKGFYIDSFEQLCAFVSEPENHCNRKELEEIKHLCHDYTDDGSAERLYEFMQKEYGFDAKK